MKYVSTVPALRVDSIAAALPLWRALGFEVAFCYAGDEPTEPEDVEHATFARLDAPSGKPISVFLCTERGAPGTVVHLMLEDPGEVDAAAEGLTEAGVPPTQPPTNQSWGMRDLEVADPYGNTVVVGAAHPL